MDLPFQSENKIYRAMIEFDEKGNRVMEKKIRVAYLGFWHTHALPNPEVRFPGLGVYGTVNANENMEAVIGWDWNETRGKHGCDILGIPYSDDLEGILAREDIDAVVIGNETTKHYEVAMKAIEYKKAIYINKLLAPTGAQATEIVQAAREKNVPLVVMLSRIHEEWCQKIRDMVQSGKIGKVIDVKIWHAHGICTRFYPSDDMGYLPEGHGFLSKEDGAGGCYADMCHPQYMLPFIMNEMPIRAYAHMNSVTGRGDVEDCAAVMYEFKNGQYAILEEGWANGPVTTDVVIHGTDGTILYRDDRSDKDFDYLVVRSGENPKFEHVPFGKATESTLDKFIYCIRNGVQDEKNNEQAIMLSYMSEAAYLSAEKHEPVDFSKLAGYVGEE